MKVLFINPPMERCGVHQYGLRLFSILRDSKVLDCQYTPTTSQWMEDEADIAIYNWHPIIDPSMAVAGRIKAKKKVIIHHEGNPHAIGNVDALLFSDPTGTDSGIVHHIGRPLPEWTPTPKRDNPVMTVGLHGFCGAWAQHVIQKINAEFEHANLRLLLPPSDYCDGQGVAARGIAEHCRQAAAPGVTVEASHEFLSEWQLLAWLSENDVNCYGRERLRGHCAARRE